ncbi:MAG: O-antigen ligase family protein [Candidatus Eisenbacteria bacterium]
MSSPVDRLRAGAVKVARPEVVGLGIALLFAAIMGFVLAENIISPNKRMIQVIMAGFVLFAAFLLPSRYSVGFMVFIIPFPQYTTIGSTTVIFAFIIFAFWILRIALGYEQRPIRSGIEVPLICLVLFFVISMVMVEPGQWAMAIAKFRIFISCILIFYLVINLIRTTRDIHFILNTLVLSFGFVAVIAMVDIWMPQHASIFNFLRSRSLDMRRMTMGAGIRVGSVFGDYELFAEYLAIYIPILLVRVLNEKIVLKQFLWLPMLGGAIMLLLATATRGAFLALIAGVLYLIWIARHIINYQKLLPLLIATFGLFYASAIILNQYTETASLFARLGETKFVKGMPDTRARRWTEAWNEIQDSPWIGHGPYYFVGVDEKNVNRLYPHSNFLFFSYLVGIPGALVFHWMLISAGLRGYKAARRYARQRTELAYTVVLLSSILVIFFVDEIKISFMRYDNTQHFTWTILALLLSVSRVAIARADREEAANRERIAQRTR